MKVQLLNKACGHVIMEISIVDIMIWKTFTGNWLPFILLDEMRLVNFSAPHYIRNTFRFLNPMHFLLYC